MYKILFAIIEIETSHIIDLLFYYLTMISLFDKHQIVIESLCYLPSLLYPYFSLNRLLASTRSNNSNVVGKH